jgi:hypothetical protein
MFLLVYQNVNNLTKHSYNQTKKHREMKKYYVNVYYQYDVNVTVSAKTESQALSKAIKMVSARKIGRKSIRRDFSDAQEL